MIYLSITKSTIKEEEYAVCVRQKCVQGICVQYSGIND